MIKILKAYTLSECMEAMADCVAEFEKKGEENVIFCEDRLTLIAERALMNRLGGTFQTSVTTFTRFLEQSSGKVLTKQGSVMAVGRVMATLQREEKLQCFTSTASTRNNAKCIYETLAQFSASEITPELLMESIPQLESSTLKRKLSDLALIYEGYLQFLEDEGYTDESKYLSLLPDKIRGDERIKRGNVFFLCYSSFTARAMQAVRAVLDSAKNVVGVFFAGEEDVYTNSALHAFLRVCNVYNGVQVLNVGVPIGGEAECLRKGIFAPEAVQGKSVKTDKIRIFEAEDKATEAEYVAVQIRKAMMENETLRYRDFAVLFPDVGEYSLPLKRAFSEYGIPYFIDEKRSLKGHPLSRFLLDAFRVVKEKFSPSSVQALTQNYFFGDSDEYRNYLLKFANYRGGAKKDIKTGEAVETLFDCNRLQEGKARLLSATKNIKNKDTGRGYCYAVREILREFDAKNKLELLESDVEDVAQKSYLSQIYDALENVLGEAELLTENMTLTVAEFSALLENGLEAMEISLIPLKADAVFLGDLTESRIEKIHTLFAVGMTENVPRIAGDDAIISDKEIKQLAEVKALLEPTVAEVNLRNAESAGLNLCTFIDGLHLSYSIPSDGNEPTTSEIFRYVDGIFCGMDGKKLPRKKQFTEEEFVYRVSVLAPAIRQLLIEKSDYENNRKKESKVYSSLFTALDKLSVQEKDDYLQEYKGHVCVERGEELFFRGGKISPTALENYFACPFKNFVERGLKLKERDETAVLSVDSGNFIHELLESVTKKVDGIETEEEMIALATATGMEIMQKPVYSAQSDTASGLFFSDKLLKEGIDVALAVYRQIKNSAFVVESTELPVSTGGFHGKVDRVDSTDKYLRIIDYKTGSIDDSATSYYTGRKLQLQLYMSALKGDKIPAGVLYFPASVAYGDEEGRFRMRGFMNGNEDALKAGDVYITEEKQSEYFPASLKNERSKRVMEESVFRDFLDYSVFVARQGSKELKEGYIAPSPYGETCAYCKYGGLCGFNQKTSCARKEESIDGAEIAEIAKINREGKEE